MTVVKGKVRITSNISSIPVQIGISNNVGAERKDEFAKEAIRDMQQSRTVKAMLKNLRSY